MWAQSPLGRLPSRRTVITILFLAKWWISDSAGAQQGAVYFKVAEPDPRNSFVIELTAQARSIVAGLDKANIHVSGIIIKGNKDYNKP
jgi:hypothetical protein